MNHIPKLSLLSFCKNKTQTNDTRRDETNVESLSSTNLTSAHTQKQKTSNLHVPDSYLYIRTTKKHDMPKTFLRRSLLLSSTKLVQV